MNRHHFLPMLLLTGLLIPATLFAQTMYSNRQGKAIIRSDSSCQSALVTNFSYSRGDRSQLLATASLPQGTDSVMECRSFLQFNFHKLPPSLKAEHIISASLVLFPMVMTGENGQIQPPAPVEISIKRVKSSWKDSLINWQEQPLIEEENEVSKQLNARKMKHAVDITVTKMVKKMMREGNFGFMITNTGLQDEFNQDVNWFGSARHQVLQFRPVLMLEYVDPNRTAEFIQSGTPFVGIRLSELDDAYQRDMQLFRENSRPANTGLPAGNGNNPPPPPVKSGSKD